MNLTDEQKRALNVGLNEWAGWTDFGYYEHPFTGTAFFGGRQDGVAKPLPDLFDPLTGLSHINRLEERLTDEEHKQYRIILWQLTTDGPNEGYEHVTDKQRRAFVSASAEQRAIALVRTLNIQIEGVTQ